MTLVSRGSVCCLLVLALAASCSSDERSTAGDGAGMAGEGFGTGGSGSSAPAASAGKGGSSGSGGASGSTTTGGSGTAGSSKGGGSPSSSGGEADLPSAGAPSGQAGDGNAPAGPVSACGAGNFDSGAEGCMACPPLPQPSPTTSVDCSYFDSASRNGDGNLLLALRTLPVHEPFEGVLDVAWSSEGLPGTASVTWQYSTTLRSFVFYLPVEARYADEISLGSWAFTDACGFSFAAADYRVYWDGVESWQCGQEP